MESLRLISQSLGLCLAALLLAACATNPPPPSTLVPSPSPTRSPAPIASPTFPVAPSATRPSPPAQSTGTLTGRVTIGPLRPVERIGEPTPTPPPELFSSRSINIFTADGTTLVTNAKINPDGTYAVTLPPGVYVVNIARAGIERARNLPQTVTITTGATLQLDIDIDTGIR